MKHLRIAIAAIGLSACTTEPIDYRLPDPDLSLDPQALVEPRVLFMCGKWVDGTPPLDAKIFVDVSFIRVTLDEPYKSPTSADLAAVERHGGQIAYKFHTRAVRAWIATAAVPELAKEKSINLIFRVTDLRRYDWVTGVGYRKPYSFEQGSVRFRELGGLVTYKYSSINAISGLVPDRSVSTLRADSNIDYIEGEEGFANCF